MKYQIGDKVAFDVPIRPQKEPQGEKRGQSRFAVGLIKGLLEDKKQYEVVSLGGKKYVLPESRIRGGAEIIQDNLQAPL